MSADEPLVGGVETGGSWCVCAIGRGPGELTAVEKFPTGDPDQTLAHVVSFFGDGGRPPVAAVGVGAFGPIEVDPTSPRWGEVLASTPKEGWAGAAVGPTVRDALNVPVTLDTDVNAAAVGERRWGAARGCSSLAYVTIGTGIGAGLVIAGTPVHGLLHPEAGHLRVPHDHARDPFEGACPYHGDCWEGLASGTAIAQRWGTDPRELPDDHPAWELEAEYVATGLLALVTIASPERVIVGGGVMDRPSLLGSVRRRLAELLGGYLDRPQLDADLSGYVVAPELGDDAGVLGAIALAAAAA